MEKKHQPNRDWRNMVTEGFDKKKAARLRIAFTKEVIAPLAGLSQVKKSVAIQDSLKYYKYNTCVMNIAAEYISYGSATADRRDASENR